MPCASYWAWLSLIAQRSGLSLRRATHESNIKISGYADVRVDKDFTKSMWRLMGLILHFFHFRVRLEIGKVKKPKKMGVRKRTRKKYYFLTIFSLMYLVWNKKKLCKNNSYFPLFSCIKINNYEEIFFLLHKKILFFHSFMSLFSRKIW